MKQRWAVGAAILLAVMASLYAQWNLWWWYVEDSAISFAYARNLAEGWGLVRFPGDERIEGYSNPTWVGWMALLQLVGITGFVSSKWTALLLTGLTVPLVARLTGTASSSRWGVVAAWMLALDASFVIWSASGLENSLFCFLMAAALLRTVLEAEEGRHPLAVGLWLLLALTRPEGVVYAALGGGWALLQEALGYRRFRRIGLWLVVFFLPFSIYHAVRYDYFAYPFPATYYAKIGEDPFHPFSWNHRGWVYLRSYGEQLGRFWLAPLILAGAVGLKGWRGAFVATLGVWLAVVLLYPGVEPFISWGWIDRVYPGKLWIQLRVVSIGLILLATTFAGIGAENWRTRLLCWLSMGVGLAFCVRSGGDWMRGFRWMSLISVPATVLLVLGIRDVYELALRRATAIGRASIGSGIGGALTTAAVLGAIGPQLMYLYQYEPETTPHSVLKRVNHYKRAMRKLHIDYADILDHDMGAMLWWGKDLGIVRDSRGLIDMAFALHRSQPSFVKEYAFEEYPFDFAHAHASTGQAVRRQSERWNEEYVEFPGYGRNNLHVGNYVRKSLFIHPWDGTTTRAMGFVKESHVVQLHGIDIPSPEVAPGSWLYVEYGLQVQGHPEGTRVMLFLYDDEGVEVSWNLPLGMETWYPVEAWRPDETFVGHTALPLDGELPLGDYKLGVAVLGSNGVLQAEDSTKEPLFATGEHRFPGVAVKLVDRKRMGKEAGADVGRSMKEARENHCLRAERYWAKARAHRSVSRDWLSSQRPRAAVPIAECFARRALRQRRADAVASMRRGRRWSGVAPEIVRVGQLLSERWMLEAAQLREQGDVEGAYALYRDVLFVDPSRSWARRYAEELRVERLNLAH